MTLLTLKKLIDQTLKDSPALATATVIMRRDLTSEELYPSDIFVYPQQNYVALGRIAQINPKQLEKILIGSNV